MGKMATGTFRLNGPSLNRMAEEIGRDNPHQIMRYTNSSYPVINRWFSDWETVKTLNLSVLAQVLVDALEIAPEEALNLRLGDLLTFECNSAGAK